MCTTPFKELSVMERGVRDLCAQLSTSTSVGLAFKRTDVSLVLDWPLS